MNLFYAPDLTPHSTEYLFNKDESRHIVKSLRKKNGDILFLTNGSGDWFEAEIIIADPKKTLVSIINATRKESRPYKIHIAIAPTKSNERFEWFLEKATEIGVDRITPIITQHSERKKINLERYNKIIVSAMKQSLQAYKPYLSALTKFEDFINENTGSQKYIALCKAGHKFMESLAVQKDVVILIGPEGGWHQQEIDKALAKNFKPVILSNSRLRTETAGVVAVTAVNLKNF